MSVGTWIVLSGCFGTFLAIIRFYYCFLANRPFFGRFLHGLIPRVIIKIRIIRYLRRHGSRRSLKARNQLLVSRG